jgi:hypothetical protein
MDVESNTPDAEESAMRELGVQVDAAEGRRDTQTPAETPRERPTEPVEASETEVPPQSSAEPTETPESPEPEPELTPEQQLSRDIKTGQFQKRERPETEYSKAQKEQVRKDRTWQNIQAEKEQIRMEKAQWEEQRRMEQLEAVRQNYQPLKQEGLTAKQYYDGAQIFEQEGDHENALKAYRVAAQLDRAEQARYAQMQQVEAEYQWRKGLEEIARFSPDFFDPGKPLGAHLERIIAQHGNRLYQWPNGIQLAAEVAHMLTQMDALKQKDDEIVALKAELEKTNRKGQPARGGYASPRTSDKEFDDMDLNEMEAHLKHLTTEADTWR